MARATLANLRLRLRRLINDTGSATWTDDQLDLALDQNRTRANQMALTGEPTRTPNTIAYYSFTAPHGNWEEDAALVDSGYNSITADTIDYATGRWTFNTAQANYPVMVTGFFYDLYATAADLLDEQVATMGTAYDFSADGGSYKRSQSRDGLVALVNKYRSQQMARTAELYRGDVNLYQH